MKLVLILSLVLLVTLASSNNAKAPRKLKTKRSLKQSPNVGKRVGNHVDRWAKSYFVIDTKYDWLAANACCFFQARARLAIIRTRTQQRDLQKILRLAYEPEQWPDGHPYVWLGGRERKSTNWVWLDGRAFRKRGRNIGFTYWKKGKPNNSQSTDNCLTALMDADPIGKWSDKPCFPTEFYGFPACERSRCQKYLTEDDCRKYRSHCTWDGDYGGSCQAIR